MLHARTLADAPGLFISHVQPLGFREGRVFPKAGGRTVAGAELGCECRASWLQHVDVAFPLLWNPPCSLEGLCPSPATPLKKEHPEGTAAVPFKSAAGTVSPTYFLTTAHYPRHCLF